MNARFTTQTYNDVGKVCHSSSRNVCGIVLVADIAVGDRPIPRTERTMRSPYCAPAVSKNKKTAAGEFRIVFVTNQHNRVSGAWCLAREWHADIPGIKYHCTLLP